MSSQNVSCLWTYIFSILDKHTRCILTIFLILLSYLSKGQKNSLSYLHFNKFIDISTIDSTSAKALAVWNAYLKLHSERRADFADWSAEEKKYFSKECDLRYRYLDYSFRKSESNYYKPTILAISKVGDGFSVKTLFSRNDEVSNELFVVCIIDVFLVREKERFVLQSALFNNMRSLNKTTKNTISVYRKENNACNEVSINKLDSINISIAKLYNSGPIKVDYFLNNSITEYQKLSGFDYESTMYLSTKVGLPQEGALSEMSNKIIFNGTADPYINFTHELVHIYTYELFPPNKYDKLYYYFFNEGISTFLGGSVGKPLSYLLNSLESEIMRKAYKFNFSDITDNAIGIGEEDANLSYIVGGLICKIAYDREGMTGIFKLLQYESTYKDIYETIEVVLGVKRADLDLFIRNELKKYAN